MQGQELGWRLEGKKKKTQKEQTGRCSLPEWNTRSVPAAGVVGGDLEVPAIRPRRF